MKYRAHSIRRVENWFIFQFSSPIFVSSVRNSLATSRVTTRSDDALASSAHDAEPGVNPLRASLHTPLPLTASVVLLLSLPGSFFPALPPLASSWWSPADLGSRTCPGVLPEIQLSVFFVSTPWKLQSCHFPVLHDGLDLVCHATKT